MGSDARWWISAIASCARRFGRNPYEHGLKSASKIGSSPSFRLAWTTRPAVQFDRLTPSHDAGRELLRPGPGAGIPRRVFGHSFPPLTDTLPPFPMPAALPRSESYGGSPPPAPSAGVAPIPASRPGRAAGGERTRVVPTFAVVRLTG